MDAKCILTNDGETAKVEFWKDTEGEVTCKRVTFHLAEVARAVEECKENLRQWFARYGITVAEWQISMIAHEQMAEQIREALKPIYKAIVSFAEAMQEVRALSFQSIQEAWEVIAEYAEDGNTIPQKKPFPRPPKKLGPAPHNAYVHKIRPTARSRCRR